MKVKYSKIYDSVILPQGYKLLVHYFNNKYYILPPWELSCEISDKGFTLKTESNSISGLCKNITGMLLNGIDFKMLEPYNKESLQKHYETLKS